MRERLRVLRHRDFRNLWLGQSASSVGDAVVLVALALYVTELTHDPTKVGIVLAAYLAPLIAFLLIGGVWADRLPRERVMIAADVARACLHPLLAVLIFTGTGGIWHIFVIEACYGTAQAFFQPAYTGIVPRTVPPGEVQQAQALSSLTLNLAELTGPAIATALVLGAGAGRAFLPAAAPCAVGPPLLWPGRPAAPAPAAEERGTVLGELK